MVTDEQIGNIITIVEENLDYDRNCHNDNCEIYAYVKDRDKIKKYIEMELSENRRVKQG